MNTGDPPIEDKYLTPWWEYDPCPDECLCHNSSRAEIAKMVGDTRPNPYFNHAVYVLECQHRPEKSAQKIAFDELDISSLPYWVKRGSRSERLIYVGLSKRAVTRLYNHVNADGGSFTKVFPPVRLLNIDWYATLAESYREDPKKADLLDEHLDDTYVFQR